MKGWQIFTHSVRLVFTNIDHALRISLVLYLVLAASQVATYMNPPVMTEVDGIDMPTLSGSYVTQNLIFAILAIIASLWIAVAWHRFVLAEEYPNGWLPRWHGPNMLGYLGRSILLGIVVVVGVTLASIPFGLIATGLPGLLFLLPFVLIGLGAYLFFRLGVMLPGAALGTKISFSDAWRATKGESGTILVLSVLVVGASFLLQLPTMLSGNPNSLISLIYGLVVNWFATIIGISVLTTLFGHFIEKRPID
ncbi:hypothetical protein P775_02020 [Puniceibacterium antarcticum]|uniref:Glycerophosphoryl diester phosphodiesterase membrane domain-containing protein n=1 Tax=Puniceibacterium antarcticum TaxID=1206336 RepID=A0A2G8RJN6_9RHOB|nr:hypothetical protein [Puniceibacterium antarcticum]PIL21770.1 hypothetical protein P775_02020 [Puniceibacterium antarcticum]